MNVGVKPSLFQIFIWQLADVTASFLISVSVCSSAKWGQLMFLSCKEKWDYIHVLTHCFSQSVQSLSRVWLFETPWIAAHQASLSITNSWSLLKLTPIESVMPSNHLILSRPAFNLSGHQGPFQWRLIVLCIKWPKYWSYSFSTSPSNEYSGLISFRIDWFDLLEAPLCPVPGMMGTVVMRTDLLASRGLVLFGG